MSKKTRRVIYDFRYGNGPKVGQVGEYFIAVVPRKTPIFQGGRNSLWYELWYRFWDKDPGNGKTVKLREARKIIARFNEQREANRLAEVLIA